MQAYVDESGRMGGEGLYLLAAVIVPAERRADIRRELKSLLPARQRRFHWRNENVDLRLRMLNAIGSMSLAIFAAVKSPTAGSRPKRSRALCLEVVLWQLQAQQVPELVIESRGDQDQDDRGTVIVAQRAGIADKELRYAFARPLEEPLLWLPDAIAGAFSACEVDPGCRYAGDVQRIAVRRYGAR